MPQHLLTCSCGRQIPVELSQAGQQLRCQCGATVSVPTFRQLRELPLAAVEPSRDAPRSTWGARQGAIAASLIIAGLLLLGAGANRYSEPLLPKFNPDARNKDVSGQIDKLGPAEAWKIWTENYRHLGSTGFVAMEHQMTQVIQQRIDQDRRIQLALVVLAAIGGVIALVLAMIPARAASR
jgi:hypothetical protein